MTGPAGGYGQGPTFRISWRLRTYPEYVICTCEFEEKGMGGRELNSRRRVLGLSQEFEKCPPK